MARVLAFVLFVTTLLPLDSHSDVVSASPTHFVLRHAEESSLSSADLWARLVQPQDWWHPEHTYSGKASNLSLELTAGGLWREDWHGGSVMHGRVLTITDGRLLRMEAPFGPLQAVGAYVVWTITIEDTENGSMVVFDEIASGPPSAKLDELAGAVDIVKTEAMRRLTQQ